MFENIGNFFKKMVKTNQKEIGSKDAAKERLHLVLMQDRANVSVDFLELMKQEIIDVIKKYIIIDESAIDVRLTNQSKEDGTNGAPALYANIPIVNIKSDMLTEKNENSEEINPQKDVMEKFLNEKEEFKKEEHEIRNINENTRDKEEIIEEENKKEEYSKVNENNNQNDILKAEGKSENIKQEREDIDHNEDEEDFDVTFDDLLKAAEEEEKEQKDISSNKDLNKKKKKKNKR